ncbi:hypothetical protein BGZ47_010923, partial [Haplosporangium gracile]
MRVLSITLAVSLALVAITKAAPLPMPMPALDENPTFDETQDEFSCVEKCLQVEEQCLLYTNSMSSCVVAFDACHTACVPEVAQPEPEGPLTTPPVVPAPEDNSIIQITEPSLDNPTIDDAQVTKPGEGALEENDVTTDGTPEETDGTDEGAPEETDDSAEDGTDE